MNAKVVLAALSIFLCPGVNYAWGQESVASSTGSFASEFLWAVLVGMVLATAGCVVDVVLKNVAIKRRR